MEQAADEEIDHLARCEQRIRQLGSHTSVLNPISMAFLRHRGLGRVDQRPHQSRLCRGDRRPCLQASDDHLGQLPAGDEKSRAILEQMRDDEAQHSTAAIEAGGLRFPAPVKSGMSPVSKVMTKATYRI